jgi:peptide-methionine (S)-S-oxide reductase
MDFIPADKVKKDSIIFGAGCFWCTEAVFKMVPGVLNVIPGYAGGKKDNPTYEQVCSGKTGHAEVAKIEYLQEHTSIEYLLKIFFAMHDPTSLNKQGNDIGTQYRSIILYSSEKQKAAINKFIKKIQNDYPKTVVTEVMPLEKFYPAEDYHKNYFEKNPNQPYCMFVITPKLKKMKLILK